MSARPAHEVEPLLAFHAQAAEREALRRQQQKGASPVYLCVKGIRIGITKSSRMLRQLAAERDAGEST